MEELRYRALIVSLTHLGDVAVLIPLATIILIWLVLISHFRSAAWWVISVVLCLTVTSVLKLFFYQCPPIPQLHSPSGHTSLSMLVYGAITLVTAAETKGLPQNIIFCGGVSLILAIAASRLYLSQHSLPEVGLGFVIGATSLVVFSQSYRRRAGASVRVLLLIMVSGMLTLALHGRTFDTQTIVKNISKYFEIYCT
jgi:membrane-associated phospholipid phosphatase